jgi:hypothetical protein
VVDDNANADHVVRRATEVTRVAIVRSTGADVPLNFVFDHSRIQHIAMFKPSLMLAMALVSCSAPTDSHDAGPEPVVYSRTFTGGLMQTVTLSSGEVSEGDVLEIRSVLENRSAAPVDVVSQICGLTIHTAMPLAEDQFVRCGGYSLGGKMRPGDTREESLSVVVGEGPGRYTIAVRHALSPELWMMVDVMVR